MKKLLTGIVLLTLIIVPGLLFIEIPYTIRAKGIVKPVKEWSLLKAFDGTLVNVLEDHTAGTVDEYILQEFQRGDLVQFLFNASLLKNEHIEAGDTIAWVLSRDLQLEVLQKQGAIVYEESLLEVLKAGDKPQAIQLALEKVELARQELTTQQIITERIIHLYEQDVVSQQEYEIAVNDLKIKEYQLEIARSAYEHAMAGEREEEIQMIMARIEALRYQKKHMLNHMADMNIRSPISGQLVRERNPEGSPNNTVIKIADLSSCIVFLPVDLYEQQYIRVGQEVTLSLPHKRQLHTGTIVGMDNSVQMINRQPRLFVTALISENDQGFDLLPNMIVDARIITPNVSLKDFILRKSRVVYPQ